MLAPRLMYDALVIATGCATDELGNLAFSARGVCFWSAKKALHCNRSRLRRRGKES